MGNVRPEVMWFAEKMEQVLQENDHKGGWKDCDFRYLYRRLHEESHEIWQAHNQSIIDWEQVKREAVDVGNFAMMIADLAQRKIDS